MFRKIKQKIAASRDTWGLIIVLAIVSVVALLPFVRGGYIWGHDSNFHLGSIYGIAQTNISSLLNIKIFSTMFNNLGYGAGIFYPQFSHLLGAIIYKIGSPFGLSLLSSIKIIHFLLLFFSGFFMFKLAQKITKNYRVSLCVAILYMVLPYHLSDSLVRDALAEVAVFTFVPVVGLSFYYLAHEKYSHFLLYFVLGCLALINSHLIMTVFVAIFFALYVLVDYKKFFSKKKVLYFVLGVFLTVGLSAPFWLSLLQHRLNGSYVVFDSAYMVNANTDGKAHIHFIKLFDPNTWFDSIRFALNIVSIFVCLIALFRMRYLPKNLRKLFICLIVFSLICVALVVGVINIRHWPSSLHMIQFAWRLVLILCFMTSLAMAIALLAMPPKTHFTIYLATFIVAFYGVSCVWNGANVSKGQSIDRLARVTTSYREYLPISSQDDYQYLRERDNLPHIKSGVAEISDYENHIPDMEFRIITSDAEVELPRLYYYGYEIIAHFDDGTNKTLNYVEDDTGLILIWVDQPAKITVRYTGGVTRVISNCIFYISAGVFVFIVATSFYRRRAEQGLAYMMLLVKK